jgi:tetratricopeptide (TPR) repeat protein
VSGSPITAFALLAAWLVMAVVNLAFAQIPAVTLTQANAALQAGEADKALALLTPLPPSGQGAAEAQNLQCRVRFTLEQWDAAANECEQAVRLDGSNSNYHMWLGRVLGQQASHASFFSAFGLAKRSLSEMQAAVQLNPKNGPALSDLGDYYAQAPGIAGGGTDKAQGIASQLDKVSPARAAQLRGDIAVAKKDYTTAETQYRQAVAASRNPAHAWTVLASFYRARQRWSDLDAAIQSCVTAEANAKASGVPLYDGAGVLIEAKRNPSQAAKMLEDYLAGSSKSEEAPAFIAHVRLGRLKQQLGDASGAQSEFAAASALAREYKPAPNAKH